MRAGSSLPEQIGTCSRLLELLVGYNRLSALPSTFAKLSSLVCLSLSGNAFDHVPEVTLSMGSLQWLWLSNNQIACLPPRLEGLTKLQVCAGCTCSCRPLCRPSAGMTAPDLT
jgi:leucine-rich repeat protein SHOC2